MECFFLLIIIWILCIFGREAEQLNPENEYDYFIIKQQKIDSGIHENQIKKAHLNE